MFTVVYVQVVFCSALLNCTTATISSAMVPSRWHRTQHIRYIYAARLVASSWQQDEHPNSNTGTIRGRQRGTPEREGPLRHGHRQQTAVPCTRFQNAVSCSHKVISATVPPSIYLAATSRISPDCSAKFT